VAVPDPEANKITSSLWLVSTEKGEPRQLTHPGAGKKKDRHAAPGVPMANASSSSPTAAASTQLWVLNLDGGEARQLTTISTGASDALWSPERQSTLPFVSARLARILREKPFTEKRRAQQEAPQGRGGEEVPVKAKGLLASLLSPLG